MQELSTYIAGAVKRRLPADVAECGKHHLLDTLAAMVSGSRLLPGRMGIAYVRSQGGVKEASVVGTRLVTSAVNAALAGGMMAHADETDDSHQRAQAHPGCGVVPAALAMAEREGSSGTALLRAVVLGYDICARSMLAVDPWALRASGISSHCFGPLFGAAAAAGALAGLDANEARYLIAYTVQQASGLDLWAADRDHVQKAFDFGGRNARNGVTAATLVASGWTGVEDVFSGEKNYFSAYSDKPDPEAFTRGLGSEFEVMKTSIKRWSVGSPIQAALDSLAALIREHGIGAGDVESLAVTINKIGAVTVNDRSIPDINIQHLLAVMLIDGTVTFASSHDERRMRDPRIRALKQRMTLAGREAFEHPRQALVEIRTTDGRTLSHHTRAVRGTAGNPLTREEVDAKSYDLMAPVLGRRRARALIDAVWEIERVRDVRKLRPLLRA